MEKNIIEKYELINGQAVIDMNYNVISANEEMYRFIGISTNISFIETIHQVDLDDFIDVCHHLRDSQETDMIVRMRRSDNSYRWILLHIARFRLKALNTTLDYYEVTASDILVLKKQYARLQAELPVKHEAHTHISDNLLYTEAEADRFCHELISQPDTEFTIVLAEIDGFKDYAEKYGESFSMSLLDTAIETTRKLLNNGRGVICKHSNSTFSIIVKNINQETNLRAFLESLRNEISWNELIQNDVENLTLSLGVVRYPQNGDDFGITLKKLSRALDICHSRGAGKYIIYREHLHGNIK